MNLMFSNGPSLPNRLALGLLLSVSLILFDHKFDGLRSCRGVRESWRFTNGSGIGENNPRMPVLEPSSDREARSNSESNSPQKPRKNPLADPRRVLDDQSSEDAYGRGGVRHLHLPNRRLLTKSIAIPFSSMLQVTKLESRSAQRFEARNASDETKR